MNWFKRQPKIEIPALKPDNSFKAAKNVPDIAPPPYTAVQTRDAQYVSRRLEATVPGSRVKADHGQLSTNRRIFAETNVDADGNADANLKALFGAAAFTTPSADRPQHNQFLTEGSSVVPEDLGVDNEDEAVEAIKGKIRNEKESTVETTKRVLQLVRDTEAVAAGSLAKLADQSERIGNTERHLDRAKIHTAEAKDKTEELKQVNGSIFKPHITWDKEKKRRKEAEKLQRRHEEDVADRERIKLDVLETQRGLRNQEYGQVSGDSSGKARNLDRKRYQFEATASDDEMEDEIDNNLDEIGSAAGRLKQLAETMGREIGQQNNRIERVAGKVDHLDLKIQSNVSMLKKIH